jgi:small-conductance mechanosensitive channel
MNRLICLPRILRLLPGLALLLAGLFPLHATAQTNPVPTTAAPPAKLKVLNREVMIFRAGLGTYTPEQRVDAAGIRIEHAMKRPPGLRVESLLANGIVEFRVHGQTVFFILPGDVDELAGETLDSLRVTTEHQLNQAISELEELRSNEHLIKAVLFSIGATLGLIIFIWLLARNRRWVESRLIKLTAGKADRIKSHSLRIIGLQNLVAVLRSLTTLVFWLVIISAIFLWLEFVLQLFPLTRPFGEELHKQFLVTLGNLGQSTLQALPDLGIVFVILGLARFAASANRRFFAAIARGRRHSRFFDPTTAPITQRLITLLIWLTAIIVAFPYIPGSQTPAFRGISVMAGLMISVGSSNLIAQLIGGLTVIYNRACRPGDYIRIGEYEGTVTSIGFFSSRLVTRRNEEVVLANSQISNGTLINYSCLNETVGVQVPLTVTIGYDTPWRQVHAMLLEAARRTAGLKSEPQHIVLQRALSDFYVEYELRVALETPMQRPEVLSELHAHTQDVFNEYGVQIMSPHFLANPPQAAVVPKEKWFAPPAKKES